MGDDSLINLGDLSKPATVLIEKISEAIGGLCKPYQIVRLAKADAKAEIIRTEAQICVTELKQRAFQRFEQEEIQKQITIEGIINQALPHLSIDSRPEELDKDWVRNFFEKCRIISDEDMQVIWSKLLAGEANTPGTFSKRTVNILSEMSRSDAELFSVLCRFCVNIGKAYPVIMNLGDTMYSAHGITGETLIHLNSLGLIYYDSWGGARVPLSSKEFVIEYFGDKVEVKVLSDVESFYIGEVLFTQPGIELHKLCNIEPVPGFVEHFCDKLDAFHNSNSKGIECVRV